MQPLVKAVKSAAAQVAPLREAVPPTTRFVLVTATLAEPVFAQLQRDFPGIAAAFGPGGLTALCSWNPQASQQASYNPCIA